MLFRSGVCIEYHRTPKCEADDTAGGRVWGFDGSFVCSLSLAFFLAFLTAFSPGSVLGPGPIFACAADDSTTARSLSLSFPFSLSLFFFFTLSVPASPSGTRRFHSNVVKHKYQSSPGPLPSVPVPVSGALRFPSVDLDVDADAPDTFDADATDDDNNNGGTLRSSTRPPLACACGAGRDCAGAGC